MARTRKSDKKESPQHVKLTKKFYVTKKLRGNINNKEYSAEAGEEIEFDSFEADVFKNFIKEE